MHLSKELSTLILKEMFNRVGATYDEKFVEKPNWFGEYTWTQEQENEFIEWVVELLKIHLGKKTNGLKEAKKIVYNYGWKVEPQS